MSANRKKFLTTSISSIGKRQADLVTGLADADLDKRIKVTVEVEDVVTTEEERDCSDVDLVNKTVEAQMKRATWTFSRVTPQIVAWAIAYFLSAAANPVDSSGKKKHVLTRSVSDDLAAFSFVDCFEDDLTTAEKYIGHKVESISIQLNRRKNVTMTMVTVGRFATETIADFDLPDCETPAALKGSQCTLEINGVDYTSLLWQLGVELKNNIPTGDDAFPFSGLDVQTLERGDQPGYTLSPQLMIRKGHAVHTDAKSRTKRGVVLTFGDDDKVVLTFPNTMLELNSRWRQFVGERNEYSTLIDATPMKDATLGTPLKAEFYGSQTAAFLTV